MKTVQFVPEQSVPQIISNNSTLHSYDTQFSHDAVLLSVQSQKKKTASLGSTTETLTLTGDMLTWASGHCGEGGDGREESTSQLHTCLEWKVIEEIR